MQNTPKKEVAIYNYTNEAGELLHHVFRYLPKTFRQCRPDGSGGLIWNLEGVPNVLFRLPEVISAVQSGAEIWITEGEKDALALVEAGVCATTTAGGAKAPWLDSYTEVLQGAGSVTVVADADKAGYSRAKTVRDALDADGVPVKVVRAKEGKDAFDHLEAKHNIDDFVKISDADLDALVPAASPIPISASAKSSLFPGTIRAISGNYSATSEGLFMLETDKEGIPYAVQLTNVDIEIVEAIRDLIAPGEETGHYHLTARCQGHVAEFDADAATLSRILELINKSYIGEPTITPGKASHVLHAMHLLSQSINHLVVYRHLGWRKIELQYLYLHGTGALGSSGLDPTVTVESDFPGYGLPEPVVGQDLVNAVTVSLQTWQVSRYVMTALLGAVWRSVLPVLPPSSIHLAGTSGTGKTTLALLALQHFGAEAGMDSWGSTANGIEATLWAASNHVVLIDEFVTNSERKRYEMEDTAERIQRAAANHVGRRRMNRDGTLQQPKHPRGFVISTGESVPGENSVSQRARVLLVELDPRFSPTKTTDTARQAALTECQALAECGVLAAGLATYVVDLAGWINTAGIDKVRLAVRDAERKWMARWTGQSAHPRTAPAVASLAAGWELWLDWVQRSGAVSVEQAAEVQSHVLEDLDALVSAQGEHIKIADPADRWVSLMVSELRGGRCHVTPRDRNVLMLGEEWGWRDGLPLGDHIGWMDEKGVYLNAEAAHSVIVQAGRRAGNGWSWSETATWRFLSEKGWLIGASTKRFQHQLRIYGRQEWVIHVGCELLVHLEKPA